MDQGSKFYQGTILPDIDLLNRGRYLVHINELHYHLPVTDGIWCRNRVGPNSWHYNTDFVVGSYGSYFPLQVGTRVLVRVDEEDYEHAIITEIVADSEMFALPLYITPEGRDQIFTIFRTPLYSNIFHINESTTIQPSNSIHFYFNADVVSLPSVVPETFGGENDPDTGPETNVRTKYIINEDGVHFYTTDNVAVTIDKDGHIAINQNVKLKIGQNADVHIIGNAKVTVDGQTDLYCTGDLNIKSDATINIQGGGDINLNSGTSAEKAEDSAGYNEFDPGDKELKGINRAGDVALATGKLVT